MEKILAVFAWFEKSSRHSVKTYQWHVLIGIATLLSGYAPISNSNEVTIATLKGKCVAVTGMDIVSNPAMCDTKMVNSEYSNGRVGFSFFLKAKDGSVTVISFSGQGRTQIHKDRDHVTQPIDRVVFVFQGSTDKLKAAGTCAFGNPYLGKPMSIACNADTDQGKFLARFLTDGVAPNVTEM